MIKIICSLIFVFFLFQPGPVLAGDGLSEVLDGIRTVYGRVPGFTVAYKREIVTGSMAMLGDRVESDPATGKIHIRSPRFLMIKQETPRPETITTDGENLWWYIPEKSIAYQYPADRLGKELHLLSDIFQGLIEVGDSFDVIQSDLGDRKEYHLDLIPNPPWQEIDHIEIAVARDSFHILEVKIHNSIGGRTRFILGEFSANERFEEEFFRFVAPEGVKIVKEE